MFRTVPLSIIRSFHCTHNNVSCKLSANQYDIYRCCVYSENSWWWTEELFETCRLLFQK